MSTRPNPHAPQWQQFKAHTPNHELHTLHDDGLYRHYCVKAPGTSCWHWDIITIRDTGGEPVQVRDCDGSRVEAHTGSTVVARNGSTVDAHNGSNITHIDTEGQDTTP